jgi:hypothetical protein
MTNRDDHIAPDVRAVLDGIGRLPVHEPPPDVWRGIERELDRAQVTVRDPHRRRIASSRSIAGIAAAALIVVSAASYVLGLSRSSWGIERIAGTPTVGVRNILGSGTLAEGEWLETDASSRARIAIGTLGSAEVGPGSRVKLVRAGGSEHALRVERGSIDARVWAPPRFFLVETPAVTAVDLGCIYTLQVDEAGNGVLLVRSGQVELRGHGRASIVVAGTAAEMREGAGPGTPYDASEGTAFREALVVIDFGDSEKTSDAVDRLLAIANARSTITLWHLLSRVDDDERARVYERLATLSAPPRGVTRDAVLALDRRALSRWRSSLEPSWSTERVRLWKRAWRAVWSMARDE